MIYKDDTLFCFVDFETTGLNTMTDYPIEIGVIVTDVNFKELDRYQTLIKDPALKAYTAKHLPAYQVHKIEIEDIEKYGQSPVEVVYDLLGIINEHKNTPWSRVVMISDNPRFEWGFMQNLFGDLKVEDVFHYSAESVNLLLHLAGVTKKKADKAHRALADAEELLNCAREAKSILPTATGVRYVKDVPTCVVSEELVAKLDQMRVKLNEITQYEPVHIKHYEMLFEVKDLLNELFNEGKNAKIRAGIFVKGENSELELVEGYLPAKFKQ